MAGRPPKDNSRDKQYRVRLNESEDRILQYVSTMTGKQKSEIFRNALEDYYNKVRVQEGKKARIISNSKSEKHSTSMSSFGKQNSSRV